MVLELAGAWLGEWVTVAVAGAIVKDIQTQLQPDEVQRVLKQATQAANQQADWLFAACPPSGRQGVQAFLREFFQAIAVRTELQKPLQAGDKPSVEVLVTAFQQQAEAHQELQHYKPDYLHPWMTAFVERYFEQIQGIHFQVARRRYLDALVNSCDDVKFVGIDAAVRERDRSANLLDIFVLPNVVAEATAQPDRELFLRELPESLEADQAELWLEQRERLGKDRGTAVSAHQLLAAHRRKVVLLGDPGSGKTTLMRYFAVKLARGEAADLGLTGGGDWFPILIYLRDWAKQPERSLIAQLEDFAANTLHVDLPVGFFQHWLAGRSLILLDGLDEVIDEATRSQLVEKLDCALAEGEHNAVVITSRPWGYNRAYFRTETFPHFELDKFNDAQIEQFIQNWYGSRHANAADAQVMMANLQESLAANDRVKQLVQNPLLLTIVALIHRYQDTLPKRRYELYDKAVSTLLKSWDRTAKGLRAQQQDFFKVLDIDDDLRRVMSLLARWIHEQYATATTEGGTLMREADLLRQLSAIIQADHEIKPYKADEEAKRFVAFIRDRTGLINEYGRGLYGFVHKTFQEYLTAEAIQSEARYDFGQILTFIQEHLHQLHWREVILLLVSQQEGAGAAQAIELIWQAGSEYEHWLHRDLLLAGACLMEDPPRLRKANRGMVEAILTGLVDLVAQDSNVVGRQPQECAQQVLRRLRNTDFQETALEMIEAKGDTIDRWDVLEYQFYLGKKEAAIAELLGLLQASEPSVRWSAADVLGQLGQGSEAVLSGLLPLLQDPKATVRWSAANGLRKLDQGSEAVLSNLLPLLQDPKASVRRRTVGTLGQLGQGSETVLTALLPLLQDPKASVRRSAADGLGKLGQGSEAVLSGLLSLLQDPKTAVRWSAADGLGKLGQGSEAVLSGLLPLLQDPKAAVRWSTASALRHMGQGSEAVLSACLPLLQDPEVYVRKRATDVLGQLGQGSETVLTALLPLLQDPDASVRGRAASALGKLGQGSEVVLTILLILLQDPDASVCGRAASALRQLGIRDAAVRPELGQWLAQQPAEAKLGAAIDALWTIVEG